jgi:hypothetical protein
MHRSFLIAGFVTLAGSVGAVAQQPPLPPPAVEHRPTIILPQHHVVTPPLRDMPIIPPGLEHEKSPHAPLPVRGGPKTSSGPEDGALQTNLPGEHGIVGLNGFEGLGNSDGVLPPDTNGDVGGDFYVQWVNLTFAIFHKDGTPAMAPASGRTLWQTFGGPCAADNDGDPIVLYDEAAGRWFMSQFALPNYPRGPFYQCIAVSRTGDPTGAWALYSYSFSKMNDYPKFGVWSDGYYMSINQFSASGTWAGQGVAAFNRTKMLNADATAEMVYFDMASNTSLGGMLPADIDGSTPPPANAPEPYIQFDDSPTELQLWQFHVNWTNTGASTFSRKALLPTTSFNSNMCNGSRNCIPQAGTTVKIDALADRMMYRLQYRNFGDHESLVTNHTVNVGSNRAGVRWYEIRNPSSTPTLYQQGTFAPADALNRWMGSVAMDKDGNLGVGYSVSNSSTYPSIRFSGQLAGAPLGTLNVAENTLQTGSGYQSHSSGRWGDYSMLAVDPSDGCTFWYTTEYYTSGATSAGWRTNIGSFRLGNCGNTSTVPSAPANLSANAASSSAINLAWTDTSGDETGFEIERCSGTSCSGFQNIFTTGAGVQTYNDTNLTPSTSYSYRVRAINATGASDYSTIASATTQAVQVENDVWVSGLTGAATASRNGWTATATITVAVTSGSPQGVTVTGTWTGGTTKSCTTDASGTCSIVSPQLSKKTTSTTFTLASLAKSGVTYVPGKNVKGSVSINKP